MAFGVSYIAYRCLDCGEPVFQECELPAFDETADSRGDASDTIICEAVCETCEAEQLFEITAYELNYYEIECVGDQTVKAMLEVPVFFEDKDHYEFWLVDDTLDDPYRLFLRSTAGLHQLAHIDFETGELEQVQLRMLYAHNIAILEAYLCDRIVSLVTYSDEVLKRFLTKYPLLGDKNVPLHAILGHPRIVHELVGKALIDFLYHRLTDVETLYKKAFDVDIFRTNTLRRELDAAMPIRHDFVHRNGRDKGGQMHSIDSATVGHLEKVVTALVNDIEQMLARHIKLRRFYFFENPIPIDPSDFDEASDDELMAAISPCADHTGDA
ncbi:hypothetical protein [Phyllobacterium sp. SB3]|uniref:hypothetical protein n=1 Tax=Phyllobacterium sp. SB3 TaxID=3156073 RepID=UPI0032B020E0